jgi:hypothetical protein
MSDRNSTDEQRKAFGEALLFAISASGLELGALAAQITGANVDTARKNMKAWTSGEREPSRPQVLMLEELLGLTPGALSCHLGWVPAGAGGSSLDVAITLDPSLTDAQRQALLQILRTFRSN